MTDLTLSYPMNTDEYYNDSEIQRKIAFHCRYREVVIIKHVDNRDVTVRPLKIFKPEHFRFWYQRLQLNKIKFDLYISNASVKLPMLSSNLQELKNIRVELNDTWMDRVTGYDFFVDIDPLSINDEPLMTKWAWLIKQEMPQDKPTEIWLTGSGGIHIIQKGKWQPSTVRAEVERICTKHDLPLRFPIKKQDKDREETSKPFVDNSIYDWRRIRRVPYSIHSKTNRAMTKI